MIAADGRSVWLRDTVHVRPANGSIELYGSMFDITAERMANLGHLAASMAHEFNNVLMSIYPFVHILRRQAGDSDHANMAARQITEAIARGKRITGEILTFANPGDAAVEPLATAAWLGNLSLSLRASLPDNIRIRIIPADVTLLCDRHLLAQVITNLANNARDAMPKGGILTIEANLDVSSGFGRISVTDTGTGMSAETLNRIWEPLFTTKRAGTGLGLPITKKLIERQNGRLTIETAEGRGTTFHIFLPLVSADAQA
jgi:signal transduction histidine kinase